MTFDYRTQYVEYRKYIDRLMKQVRTPVAQASLAVVGSLLFAAFLAVAALRPTVVTVASLIRNVNDERQSISILDKKIQSLQIAQKKLSEIKSNLAPANVAIPDHVSIEDFTKELEILAREHALVLLEVHQEGFLLYNAAIPTPQPGSVPSVSQVPIGVVVGGSEDAIRAFLVDLENLDRLVVVTNANFSEVGPEGRKDNPYPLSANLALTIFTTQTLEGGSGKKPVAPSVPTGNSL